jgi:hypothetical protein
VILYNIYSIYFIRRLIAETIFLIISFIFIFLFNLYIIFINLGSSLTLIIDSSFYYKLADRASADSYKAEKAWESIGS